MNPSGVNLADVWTDVPPVRHAKYKRRKEANELSIKLLDRIIEMASDEGDVVFDPFGGSGTTYAVSEIKARRWIGCEIGPIDEIVARFAALSEEREYLQRIRTDLNCLFTAKILSSRRQNGLWTAESVRAGQGESQPALFSSAK
jgi:site-specific DNA-methyltransferase (adenine-specific)